MHTAAPPPPTPPVPPIPSAPPAAGAAAPDAAGDAEVQALGTLLHLARRARHAASAAELGFIAVNETHALSAYRQAVLWLADRGVAALSGVVSPEANAPYVQWLERVCRHLDGIDARGPKTFSGADLPPELAAEWQDWLPARALWLPLADAAPAGDGVVGHGALVLARDAPWGEGEQGLLAEWGDMLAHAWARQRRPNFVSRWRRLRGQWQAFMPSAPALRRGRRRLLQRRTWRRTLGRLRRGGQSFSPRALLRTLCSPCRWGPAARAAGGRLAAALRAWWRRPLRRYAVLLLLFLLFPVRLSVLAPGELVPAQPAVIRAPLEGTVDRFFVAPNSRVKQGDPLFQLDLTTLESRLELARQGLATAEAEYRQAAQQAVFEAKSKVQLALLQGRIAERQTEVDFLVAQLARAQVTAPLDGIALMDDSSEWVGKPVMTGERIMTVADEHDVEVEAWISLGDGIVLPENAAVTLYLNAAPLSPVTARVRYYAHDAVPRPDGSFAYRLRARLEPGEAPPRVGMKGTAKIKGPWVTLSYWVLRRPLAILRQVVGL